MDWFKMKSKTPFDPKLDEIYEQLGHRGIVFFYTLLCMIGEEYDGNPDKSVGVSLRQLASRCFVRRKYIDSSLETVALILGVSYTVDGQLIKFRYPKFLEMQQKYNRDGRGKFTPHKEEKRKEEEEKRKEENGQTLNDLCLTVIEKWNSCCNKSRCSGTPKQISIITKKIKKLFKEKIEGSHILEAIENYWNVIKDENCFQSYVWSLDEFLCHSKAYKYYPPDFNIKNFMKEQTSDYSGLMYEGKNSGN